MTDANYSTRTSPPARTSSLADLVHKTEIHPPPPASRAEPPPRPIDSDDGSQQERNHQRPSHPVHNLPRLPPPQDVSRSGRHADTSPKHPYRKRKHSQGPGTSPPDLSSLTQKPEDHASSVANRPPLHDRPSRTSPGQDEQPAQPGPERVEGSTEINPAHGNMENHSPSKQRRRSSLKDPPQRTELLEENRVLRIELESLKYRLRKAEQYAHKLKKEMQQKDTLLAKYRAQLVELFESGDGDLFQVNKSKYIADSPQDTPIAKRRDDANSKVDGESISNSQEEDWSTYSAPSMSMAYDQDKYEERRRGEKDPYAARSEGTIRKHRRTRAPAWTREEEMIFMEAYKKHGCQWKLFQDSLPGRSRRQIQSHGSYLIRQGKLLKKNSRPWQRRKPRPAGPSSSVKDAEVEGEDLDRSDKEQ